MWNRSHIWTFAAAWADGDSTRTYYNCPCSNTNITWPHATPQYVGQDYFCGSNWQTTVENKYAIKNLNDNLWDGVGCGPTTSCCEFNRPPYFCKHLNYTTSDDMEIRLVSHSYTSSRNSYQHLAL